jgi:Na+-transporting NADH:ubiquinone oxidoreductase subunit A
MADRESGVHRIRKGLDVPITGAPEQRVDGAVGPARVAVLGDDYHGLRARVHVEEGQEVQRGQLLFEDRKNPGVRFVSPGAGRVAAVNRGAQRALLSIVVELSAGERSGRPEEADELVRFGAWRSGTDPRELDPEDIRALLVESGLWTALRTRPFSKVPAPGATPDQIFVAAMDTRPLSGRPELVIEERRADFERGLRALARLGAGATYVCVAEDSALTGDLDAPVEIERFAGPHPAGLSGTHIHLLSPVGRNRTVWTVGYQDVLAVGRLFAEGVLPVERVVALGGPGAKAPRLLRTRLGVSLADLTRDELTDGELRVVSGSVLDGKKAMGEVFGFLGRYDDQISVIAEERVRPFLGWLAPGGGVFSTIPVFLSRLTGRKRFAMTTSTHGSPRAMVPIGMYERVMPLDVVPTYLLRSLVVGDVEQAEKLGALELDEEDLALCTFVCPGKTEYGPILRQNLERLEAEG